MKSLEYKLRAELKEAQKEIERLKKIIRDLAAAPYDPGVFTGRWIWN